MSQAKWGGREEKRDSWWGEWHDHMHRNLKQLDVNWELYIIQSYCNIKHEAENGGKIKTWWKSGHLQ